MKQQNKNLILTILFIIIYIATFITASLMGKPIPIVSQFMAFASIVVIFALFRKVKFHIYTSIFLFAVFSVYLGQCLRLYSIIPFYDSILHLFSGFLIVFWGNYFYSFYIKRFDNANIPIAITVAIAVLLGIASAAIWEIWEFSGDVLFGLKSQQDSLYDTMIDIIMGTIGSIIGGVALYLNLKKCMIKNRVE